MNNFSRDDDLLAKERDVVVESLFPFQKLIFWEPCLSPHKADFFEALVSLNPAVELVCCADSDIPDDRRVLGWSAPQARGYRNIVAPDPRAIEELVANSLASTLHIFSGIRWFPTIVRGLATVKAMKGRYAIMSEPRVAEGWRGKLRLLQSWLTEGYHRQHAAFILAIGRNGPSWFKAVGYDTGYIFPFAYFVSPPIRKVYDPPAAGHIRIGYLGRFVKMKGVHDLVQAAGLLRGSSLELVGAGVEELPLRAQCEFHKVNAVFAGVLPIMEIGAFFGRIDVLVLASTSTDDGWGVVVSEALMSGVAVVASSAVGASLVLDRDLFGRCVPPSRPAAIANAISDLERSGEFTPAQRQKRAVAAINILSARAGAEYLMRVVEWYEGRRIERPQDFHRRQSE